MLNNMNSKLAKTIETAPYLEQEELWPSDGRHILAQHDRESIIVYQAYRPEIGEFASDKGFFGGPFSYSRMSWIKPNFLWMMYRSGWGTKPGQEITLAVRLPRSFFDEVLAAAVPSSYSAQLFEDRLHWQAAVRESDVRLQWDPDHDPAGHKMERRAIQLGLRAQILDRYGKTEPLEITDISRFVAEQRAFSLSSKYDQLMTPLETVYQPENADTQRRLGLSTF